MVRLVAFPLNFSLVSEDLKCFIENIGKKSNIEEIKALIKHLCSLYPVSIQEISALLKRNPKYVKEVYLKDLVELGILEYIFSHQPSHPHQAYRTKK